MKLFKTKLFRGVLAVLFSCVLIMSISQKSYAWSDSSYNHIGYMHFDDQSMSFVDVVCSIADYQGYIDMDSNNITCDFRIDGYCKDCWGMNHNIYGGADQTTCISIHGGSYITYQQIVMVGANLTACSDDSSASGWFQASWE